MHIVVSKHGNVVRSLTFETDIITIGSDPDAQVHLPDGRIARRQAQLLGGDGGWVVEPLSHVHTLILDAEVADERTPIKNGCRIHLGDFTLRVYFDADTIPDQVETAVTKEATKLRRHPLPSGSLIRGEEEITLRPQAKTQVADFALRLVQCIDFSGLLNFAVDSLLKNFDAWVVWIGVRRKSYGELEFVEGERKDGKSVSDPPHLATFRYRCIEQDQCIVVPHTEEKETQSALAIPLLTERGCLGLIYLNSPAGSVVYGERNLHELMMYGALITRRLKALIAGQVETQAAVVAGELSFVREVQSRQDPTMVPEWEQLQLAVYCKPGLERTGDVFDVMRLPNGLASFLVAHVGGADLRTAMAMVEVRSVFRMAAMHADPPHILLRALDWMMRNDREPCRLQCAAVVMNPKTGACEYATAGDIGAIIVDDTGEPRVLADPSIPALGEGNAYSQPACSERLASRETLVFYSPGCRNIMDAEGNRLGDGPLTGAFCDSFGQSATTALEELLTDLSAFFKRGRHPDDSTVLLVHRA
ncbi:MAG: SpoIIE family protein phosphatase [Phycisphaerae bacterium]|nr:SpoIIE family protein phosphatase [Phycisphaerae bacterium]